MLGSLAATSPWREVRFPDSTADVGLHRLGRGVDGSFTALVRFPVGWSRPATGWYDQVEEVLLLEGHLAMSEVVHRAGDHLWLPAGYERASSRSDEGALAVAWFSGPATWSSEPSPVARAAAASARWGPWVERPVLPSPLGEGAGRPLVEACGRRSWMLDGVPGRRPAPEAVDLLVLADLSWMAVAAGEVPPAAFGPVLCAARVPDQDMPTDPFRTENI